MESMVDDSRHKEASSARELLRRTSCGDNVARAVFVVVDFPRELSPNIIRTCRVDKEITSTEESSFQIKSSFQIY